MTDHQENPTAAACLTSRVQKAHPALRAGLIAVLAVTALFALGAVSGMIAAMLEGGASGVVIALAIAAAGIGALCLWLLRLVLRGDPARPAAPSVRKGQQLLIIAAVLGGVLGLWLSAGQDALTGEYQILGNQPLPPIIALVAIGLWLVLVPLVTWQWFRTVDEHERRAYNFGSIIALHAYVFAMPAWWIGWRGGFLPQPDHIVIFLGVCAVWTAGWLWRRYF